MKKKENYKEITKKEDYIFIKNYFSEFLFQEKRNIGI